MMATWKLVSPKPKKKKQGIREYWAEEEREKRKQRKSSLESKRIAYMSEVCGQLEEALSLKDSVRVDDRRKSRSMIEDVIGHLKKI